MLKKRVLTAVFLIPLVLLFVFKLNSVYFSALLMSLMLFSMNEWFNLLPLENKTLQCASVFLGAAMFVCLYFLPIEFFIKIVVLWWIYFSFCLCFYPKMQNAWSNFILMFVSMFVILGGCFYAIYHIRMADQGSAYLLYLLCLIWGADTGAYFSGKAFGRVKLIPNVSPGKTVEGACGALVAVLIISYVGQCYFNIKAMALWYLVGGIVLFSSIFGDLLISMFKRRVNLKDTGNILPGHGGLLDRIDSLLSASVFFYFSMSAFNFI